MSDSIRVLIVDDEAAARSLHGRFVAALEGFTVVGSAGTGESAVAQARGAVDLVLLDMHLPDISGVEVLHRIRAAGDEGPDVLVLSSSRDQVTVRQALAAHVAGYLVKPFTERMLHDRLRAYALERRARESGASERPLTQSDIDRLHTSGRPGADSRVAAPAPVGGADAVLPKGLSPVTLERVRAALGSVAPLSASDVANICGISHATARRYLDHLVASGVIDLAHRYGRRGRPRVLYRLTPSPGG